MSPHVASPPRFGGGPITTGLNLGPLASLPGTWRGTGFNAIWRPDNPESEPGTQIKRFLELNLTDETIDFHVIPGVVPNRGMNPQQDLHLYGLHYLQRVSDADRRSELSTGRQALHIEPGLFMNVPESEQVPQSTIVRLASIPHGVSVLMQGPNPGTTPGPLEIPTLEPFAGFPGVQPFTNNEAIGIQPINADGSEHVIPEVNLTADVKGSQSNGPYPATFKQSFVENPNSILEEAIAGQEILGAIEINLSTEEVEESIGNIPFLGVPNTLQDTDPTNANAFVYSARATFWIEWVRIPGKRRHDGHGYGHSDNGHDAGHVIEPYLEEPTYLQLQYSQLVILIFNNVLWPHVTVATLTLSAG